MRSKKITSMAAIVLRKSGEKEIVFIGGNFKGHIERIAEDSEGKRECYGCGVTKKEPTKIFGFYAAMDMTVGNTLFKWR